MNAASVPSGMFASGRDGITVSRQDDLQCRDIRNGVRRQIQEARQQSEN